MITLKEPIGKIVREVKWEEPGLLIASLGYVVRAKNSFVAIPLDAEAREFKRQLDAIEYLRGL